MYSRLIDDICREKRLSVAFLGMDCGTPAFFESMMNPNFSSELEAKEFDGARRKWLGEWRPEALLVIDRWDGVIRKEGHFDVKLRSFLKDVCPLARRVILVCQVPVLNVRDEINLREFVIWRMGTATALPRLDPDSNEAFRRFVTTNAESARLDFPNFRVLRADLPFYQGDGSVKYACGRAFFYANDNHLSSMGAESVRALFEQAIAEATLSKP